MKGLTGERRLKKCNLLQRLNFLANCNYIRDSWRHSCWRGHRPWPSSFFVLISQNSCLGPAIASAKIHWHSIYGRISLTISRKYVYLTHIRPATKIRRVWLRRRLYYRRGCCSLFPSPCFAFILANCWRLAGFRCIFLPKAVPKFRRKWGAQHPGLCPEMVTVIWSIRNFSIIYNIRTLELSDIAFLLFSCDPIINSLCHTRKNWHMINLISKRNKSGPLHIHTFVLLYLKFIFPIDIKTWPSDFCL